MIPCVMSFDHKEERLTTSWLSSCEVYERPPESFGFMVAIGGRLP